MSRDFASIQRGAEYGQTTFQNSEISGLPPGFINGYRLILDNDLKVTIGPGIANVNGKQVTNPENHILRDTDWKGDKVGPRFYYLCIDERGMFYVTSAEPVYDEEKTSYYDPYWGYRAIGELWVDTDADIKFVTSQFTERSNSVVIASSTYQGEADYICPGANDQILIQAAIDFLSGEYSGGTVEFSEGTFVIAAAISLTGKNRIIIRGRGDGTILDKNCNDFVFTAAGGAGTELTHFSISNLRITRDAGDTNAKAMMYFSYVDDLRIEKCTLDIPYDDGINLANCDNFTIINNAIRGIGKNGIYCTTSSGRILDNDIDGVSAANTATGNGIEMVSPAKVVIAGNSIHDIAASVGGGANGIAVQTTGDVAVTNNYIYNLSNDAGDIFGIAIINASKGLVSNNKITNLDATQAAADWCEGILVTDSDHVIIHGNEIDDCDASNTVENGIGIDINSVATNSDDCLIGQNLCINCSGKGIYIDTDSARNLVTGNSCFNNGADAGIANTNEDNFDDDGTDTYVGL